MNARAKAVCIAIVLCLLVLSVCATKTPQPPPPTATATRDTINMVNPASAYCVEQGFKLEIRTVEDGSQYAVCNFPDGRECEEWAFFRGKCAP